MRTLTCKHCGGNVEAKQTICPNCGIPLPPNHATQRERIFVVWFVLLMIFCFFMMIWLPPNWSSFANT